MARTKVRGVRAFKRNMRVLRVEAEKSARAETIRSANRVHTNVVADLRENGASGSSATKPNAGELKKDKDAKAPTGNHGTGREPDRGHVPSQPYTPPNSNTGQLMDGYGMEYSHTSNTAYVGTNDAHALPLELGAHMGDRILLPRPHLLPRYYEELRKFLKNTRNGLKKASRKAKR